MFYKLQIVVVSNSEKYYLLFSFLLKSIGYISTVKNSFTELDWNILDLVEKATYAECNTNVNVVFILKHIFDYIRGSWFCCNLCSF